MAWKITSLIVSFALSACQGPAGPIGPQGEPGPRGFRGEEIKGTFIDIGYPSLSLYDGAGRIIVDSRLITTTSYRDIYFQVSINDYVGFYKPPQNFAIEVQNGRSIIFDPDHYLLEYHERLKGFRLENDDGVITDYLKDAEFMLMALVTD